MDYLAIQKEEIKNWRVDVVENSTCWNRTHAHCDGSRRLCKWYLVDSYKSLFTLLHEIGHFETNKSSMKVCESESEATRWAVNRLRALNLPIKRKHVKRYKDYVAMTYDRGMRRGLSKKIKSKLYMAVGRMRVNKGGANMIKQERRRA